MATRDLCHIATQAPYPHGYPRTVSFHHPRAFHLATLYMSHHPIATPGLCYMATLKLRHITMSSSKEAWKAGD